MVLKITGSRSNLPTFFIHFEIELENSIIKCNGIIKKKLINKPNRSKNLLTLIKCILNSYRPRNPNCQYLLGNKLL
jgi:hypothetical protein